MNKYIQKLGKSVKDEYIDGSPVELLKTLLQLNQFDISSQQCKEINGKSNISAQKSSKILDQSLLESTTATCQLLLNFRRFQVVKGLIKSKKITKQELQQNFVANEGFKRFLEYQGGGKEVVSIKKKQQKQQETVNLTITMTKLLLTLQKNYILNKKAIMISISVAILLMIGLLCVKYRKVIWIILKIKFNK